MFESFMAVPAHFTAEFLGFLVFAAGAILVFTRSDLIPGETSNRINAAIGFGLLTGAQVLHGGSFTFGRISAETDGATILIGLKAVGLAFVVIGVVGSLKSSAAAIAGWELREPLLLAPAIAGVVLFFAALAGAKTHRPYRRLAFFGLFFGISEALTAAVPAAVFGTRTVTAIAYAAHGVKTLSFLTLAWWLWSAVRSSIRLRFVASFAALLVAVVLALSTALTGVISSSIETEELARVASQVEAAKRELQSDLAQELRQDSAQLAQDSVVVRQRMAGRNDVPGLARDIRDTVSLGLDHGFVMLMDQRGRVLGFSGDGPAKGTRARPTSLRRIDIVTINGSGVIGQVVDGGSPFSAGSDRVGSGKIAIVAANEVGHPSDPRRRVGVLAIGRWIDTITLQGIADRAGARASLVVDGRTIGTTVRRAPARGLIPASLRNQVQSCPPQPVTAQSAIGNLSFFSAFACLEDASGQPISTLVLSSPASSVIETRGLFTRILFLIAMGVGATALVLAWFSGRAITRPIQELTVAAGSVREGNLQAQAPVHGEDEVGQLGETFNEMTASLFRMTNDLREAAREEHALRARIETIIESMADGLVAVDSDRNVLAFNAAAEEVTGVRADAAMGRPVQEVLDARDGQGSKVTLPVFDLARGAVDGIFLRRENGDVVPIAVVSAVLAGVDGSPSGAVAVLRDMTREREIERMKSEFLSNISHELRTPLTPIKGYAEILGRKDIPPDKAQKFASGILESTARLERIVALLVDFSAMEAGRLAPKTKSVDIAGLVSELTSEWESRTPKHSISVEVAPSLPPVVGDERLLRRSLEEVLDNAVKFSPGGGSIRVAAEGKSSSNGAPSLVAISVTDEGIGISPEDMGRIFSDFQQLDGSETRAYGGLGLGLAFVRRIIEAHDGSVDVKSRPEEGTTFTITIPAAKGPSSEEGS